jgi:hypothetical protein
MPDAVVLVGLAVAGLVVFLVYKGVLSAREAKAERIRGLRVLGFEPVERPPEDVRDAILALHRHGKKPEHKIDEVFERRSGSDRFVLFDLEDTSGDTDHTGVMAVFSPRLQSPRLTISPRLEGGGRLAALGNMLLKKAAHHSGGTVDFAAHGRFSRRHFVSGPDPEAIRRFLTARRLDGLAEMKHIAVEANGRVFTCAHVPFGGKVGRIDRESVTRRAELAEQLLGILGS